MIFNEIYGAYYNTVSKIIKKAVEDKASSNDIKRIITEYAYAEAPVFGLRIYQQFPEQ